MGTALFTARENLSLAEGIRMAGFDFDSIFCALTGQQPFAWQRRLYQTLAGGNLPDAVDVPTGLGKTKIMALWLIARAQGSALPRRLIYVVDRRVVVDQASDEAETLAAHLDRWLADPNIDVALRSSWSRNLGLINERDLPISTLRGQFIDNRRWLDRPEAAAIVVGTIDMIGSRLLFGGYGVSPGMRPAHAGLLGADTLIVLDEAHLVPPFEALLRQVAACTADDCSRAPAALVPPLRVMALSATGRTLTDANVFRLTADDEADPDAGKRLTAQKRIILHPQIPVAALAEALAERAWALAEGQRAILVFCNSRRTAQDVRRRLVDTHKAEQVALLVGERRVRERERLRDATARDGAVIARFRPNRHRNAPTETATNPAFVVASSAGEVGIDLDADDMVCDLVSWERMVQRFGRVNRRAEPSVARIEIIPAAFDRKKDREAEDEIAPSILEKLQKPFMSQHWPRHQDGALDGSPLMLTHLKGGPLAPLLKEAESEDPLRPALTRPLVQAWAMNSLDEHSGRTDIEPWLRGWVKREPQTSVAWRRRFPLRGSGQERFADDELTRERDLEAFFAVAPPHLIELLEAPSWRVAEVLKKRAEAWLAPQDAGEDSQPRHPPIVVVLNRRNEVESIFTVDRIADEKRETLERRWANRTLVVDARIGGLDLDGLLEAKMSALSITIDGEDWGPLETVPGRRIRWGERMRPEGDWQPERYVWREDPDGEDSNELWVEVWRGRRADPENGDAAISRQPQTLQNHHRLAVHEATAIAHGLHLPEPYRMMLITAAALHDTGKAREVWQNAMRAPREGRPYAKTRGGGDVRTLAGYRHEFGSLHNAGRLVGLPPHLPDSLVSDLESSRQRLNDMPDAVRGLLLHVISAHHGNARPVIAPVDPHAPPSASAELAREVALRFERLQRHWGPWGLAWWEALLRAADWAASRQVIEEKIGEEESAVEPAPVSAKEHAIG